MVTTINEAANHSLVKRSIIINARLYQQIKELAKAKQVQVGFVITDAFTDYLNKTESHTGIRKLSRSRAK